MTSYTHTMLTDVMNLEVGVLKDITAPNAEKIIDLAVDALVLFGAELDNMAGTAGAKTISLEQKQHAAVLIVARAIYLGFYKDLDTANLGPLSVTTADVMRDPATLQLIKDAAAELKKDDTSDSGMQVLVG